MKTLPALSHPNEDCPCPLELELFNDTANADDAGSPLVATVDDTSVPNVVVAPIVDADPNVTAARISKPLQPGGIDPPDS